MENKKISRYHYYYFTVIILSLSGLITSSYLLWSHYRNYTDIIFSSFCAISKRFNCDTVSQSSWSILLDIPVALWGTIGYLYFLTLAIPAYKNNQASIHLWRLLSAIGVFYSLTSIFFGYIASTKIHSYCILCIITYIINFLLFYIPWITYRRISKNYIAIDIRETVKYIKKNLYIKIATTIIIIILTLSHLLLPHYWQFSPPPLPENTARGTTVEGYPWIGAEHPMITIEEYTDYRCFQCYKMHCILRILIAKNPDRIRLVHHHYPMDHEVNAIVVPVEFHIGSGKLAKLAILSGLRNKFWELNDLLYAKSRENNQEISLQSLADATKLDINELEAALTDPTINELLRRDIWHGMKLGLTGTPSFVINGKVYQGTIPPEIIQSFTK